MDERDKTALKVLEEMMEMTQEFADELDDYLESMRKHHFNVRREIAYRDRAESGPEPSRGLRTSFAELGVLG